MTKISFIYFDVGGVAILDFSGTNKWQEMKAGLGVDSSNDAVFEALWKKYRQEICIGYDIEQMVPVMRDELNLNVPQGYSFIKDFVDRYDPNPAIWPVIAAAQKKYKTGLLTNMYPSLLAGIYARTDLRLDWPWNVTVDSSVVKAQKPDRKIFEIAEKMAGVPHSEILFIDNGAEHIRAAQEFGWQTYLYDSSNPESASAGLAATLSVLQ